MRRLLGRARTEAPFLFAEGGSLSLTRSLRRVGGGPEDFGTGPVHSGLELHGSYAGRDLRGARISACDGTRGTFEDMEMEAASWVRCQLPGARLARLGAQSSTWDVVDLEGARIDGLAASGAHFCLVSLRDADLAGCDLSSATFVLCDFSGARLRDVDLRGSRLVGCDLHGVWTERVDARGADLRSSSLRYAWLAGLDLDGAEVDDADLCGACGLDRAARDRLARRGARLGGGWAWRAWAALLARDGSPAGQLRAKRAATATWAALAIAIPVLFFARAACNPAEPDYGPGGQEEEAEQER